MLDCLTTGVLAFDGEASTNMGFRLCRSLFYPPNFRISNFRLCLQNWIALPHPALPFRRPLFASPLQRPLPSESPKLKDDTQDLQRVDDSVSLFDPPRDHFTRFQGELEFEGLGTPVRDEPPQFLLMLNDEFAACLFRPTLLKPKRFHYPPVRV